MAFFEFPHTRTYDSDLGWLINAFNDISSKLDEYLKNAVITFADPITWDITAQYTALTCVVDSDGTAYLSKRPVPSGVDIHNTDYWMPIFNYGQEIYTIRSQIAYNAGENDTTDRNLNINDLVFYKGLLYKVIADMTAGSAFIIGTNIQPVTVSDMIQDLYTEISDLNVPTEDDIKKLIIAHEKEHIIWSTDIGIQPNTDITTALNDTLDKNMIFVLEPGVYTITDTITLPEKAIFYNKGTIICDTPLEAFSCEKDSQMRGGRLLASSTITAVRTNGDNVTVDSVYFEGFDNKCLDVVNDYAKLHNIMAYNCFGATQAVVSFYDCHYGLLDKLEIKNCHIGVTVNGGYGHTIQKITAIDVEQGALLFDGLAAHGTGAYNCNASDIFINGQNDSYGGLYFGNGSNRINVTNVIALNCVNGVRITSYSDAYCHDINITNVVINTSTNDGIAIQYCRYSSIANVTIQNSASVGLALDYTVGCDFNNIKISGGQDGIVESAAYCKFTDINIQNLTRYGITCNTGGVANVCTYTNIYVADGTRRLYDIRANNRWVNVIAPLVEAEGIATSISDNTLINHGLADVPTGILACSSDAIVIVSGKSSTGFRVRLYQPNGSAYTGTTNISWKAWVHFGQIV